MPQPQTASQSPETDEQIKILDISIRELTNKYTLINSIHDQNRVKVLALLAAVVAGATYIFSDLETIVPPEAYGKFLLIFGSFLLFGVFGILLTLISNGEWESPVEAHEVTRATEIYATKKEYLQYIQKDYLTAIAINSEIVNKNGKMFNRCIYILVVSVIILMAIKGGTS